MTMINPNVMRAIGEVLESHNVTLEPNEPMANTVARVLHLSDGETERWIEALSEGCTVEEANARVGIAPANHRGSEPLMVAVARMMGRAMGKMGAIVRSAS